MTISFTFLSIPVPFLPSFLSSSSSSSPSSSPAAHALQLAPPHPPSPMPSTSPSTRLRRPHAFAPPYINDADAAAAWHSLASAQSSSSPAMADRVHPMPSPSSSSSPLPPPPGRRRPDHHHAQQFDASFSAYAADADADDPAAAPAVSETTPLHPSFFHDHHRRAHSPPPGTYIIQVPKDQVLREPPPDRARLYKKLSNRPARRRRLRRACCLSCAAVLAILLAVAAFVGAVYLIFRPRAPSFSVPSLTIRGLDASAVSSSSTALSPALDAAVRADNGRNRKVSVEYRPGGDVAVSYAGQWLAVGPWPAFRQPPRNVTVVTAAMRGQGVRFTESEKTQLAAERATGAVPLTVEVRVPVRLRFGKVLRTWTVDVKASCEVAVDRLDGNAMAVNRGCRVKVKPLWWWW